MELTQEQYEKLIQSQALQAQTSDASTKQMIQQMAYQEQDKGLAEAQLEVETILENIENLLKGKKKTFTQKEGWHWVESTDAGLKILSEQGVQRIMQTVRFHINRNTLLSNFNEEQINRSMLLFCQAMNGLVFQKYEVLFREPTFEECKIIFEKKLEERKKIKMFVRDFMGKDYTEDEISMELEREMEGRIAIEIDKIKDELISLQLKEYDLLLEEIESQVWATYNRAFGGEERGSLRRHTQFSDIRTSSPLPQQKQGGLFGWLTGK
jgi:hypothetical protein